MTSELRFRAGLALIALAIVGAVVMTLRFDRGAVARVIHEPVWRIAAQASGPSAEIGRFALPSPGVLRAMVCPASTRDARGATVVRDPRLTLVVRAEASGSELARHALVADASRANRCYEATYRTERDEHVTAQLVRAPDAAAPAPTTSIDVRASRRITARAMWPVLLLLLGFWTIALARRDDEPAAATDAPAPPYRRAEPVDATSALDDVAVITGPPAESTPVDRPYAAVLVVVTYFAIMLGVPIASILVLWATGRGAAETGTFFLGSTLVQHGLLIVAAAWFLGAFKSERPREALGLLPLTHRQLVEAFVAAAALVGVAIVTTKFIRDISASPMGQLIERVPIRYAIGFAALLAPISEELFFRGVLLRATGRRNPWIGVVASASLFTLAHAMQLRGALIGLVPIATVALVNGYLRVRSRGITQPCVVHTLYNGLLSMGIFLAP